MTKTIKKIMAISFILIAGIMFANVGIQAVPAETTYYPVYFNAGYYGTIDQSGPSAIQSVEAGGSAESPTVIVNKDHLFTGMEFKGWDKSLENINEPTYINAQYEKKKYNVNFHAGANGRLDGNTTQVVTHNSFAQAPTVIPDEGYYFKGWDVDISNKWITSNLEVTALYTNESVTVTFDTGNKGTITNYNFDWIPLVPSVQVIGKGGKPVYPSVQPNEGYLFNGWWDNLDKYNMPITEDTTINALYTKMGFIVPEYTELKKGEVFDPRAGVTAIFGEKGGDLTDEIVIENPVDINTAGIYRVKYTVNTYDLYGVIVKYQTVIVNDGNYVIDNNFAITGNEFNLKLDMNDIDLDESLLIKKAGIKIYDLITGELIKNPKLTIDTSNIKAEVGTYVITFKYNPIISIKVNVTEVVDSANEVVDSTNKVSVLPKTGNYIFTIISSVFIITGLTLIITVSKVGRKKRINE